MTGLTLIGLGDSGDHLVVETADGTRLSLPITDELRRTVRRGVPADRTGADGSGADGSGASASSSSTLSPREIQQRLRAGLTPAELAELSGEPLAAIEKFAAPVLAEREYVVDQARSTRIGRDSSSPVLDDLVLDRIAARGAEPDSVSWDAWRAPDEPWRVAVDFRASGRTSRAVWTYDHNARSLTADDEEAQWLTETELLDAPIPRRHLMAVKPDGSMRDVGEPTRSGPFPLHPTAPHAPHVDRVMSDGAPPSAAIPVPPADQVSPTEALLDELNGMRGTREQVATDADLDEDDEGFEGFGPASHSRTAPVGFGGAPAPVEQPQRASTPSVEASRAGHPAGTGSAPPTPAGGERKPRKGRASVPSWDEIVFGAKTHGSE